MTSPCPKPCGSDSTPNAFSSLSGAPASFMPPPTRTQMPRMSGVPSDSRLTADARCDTFVTGAFAPAVTGAFAPAATGAFAPAATGAFAPAPLPRP
ncbi:MAG: hypothetical protein DMF88_17085 [Acidobacteria bacterium]|nr:MAG: hypothetical protein DMF88_17085 [Acidobacteriota bacterium]